jgi:hypothetical protein
MQPRRSAPKEGDNVTATRDYGRVTAIPYSRLTMRLRSLAIILPIYVFTITRVHICNRIPLITIRMPTRPNAGIRALTVQDEQHYTHPNRRSCIRDNIEIDTESENSYFQDCSLNNSETSKDNCEEFLQHSKFERKQVARKNLQPSKVVKKKAGKPLMTYGTQAKGIDGTELRRRKAAGECQCCAWPKNRKGAHKTLECYRWAGKDKGTGPLPRAKHYQRLRTETQGNRI